MRTAGFAGVAIAALALTGGVLTACGSSTSDRSAEEAAAAEAHEEAAAAAAERASAEEGSTDNESTPGDGSIAPTPGADDDADPAVEEAMQVLADDASEGLNSEALGVIADSGDARFDWFVADLLRFYQGTPAGAQLVNAHVQLTGQGADADAPWSDITNQLMVADFPAPPGYLDAKRTLYTSLEPRWEPFFEPDASIDWRFVGWGGVLPDDRPFGDSEPCIRGCIPALDTPGVTSADEGDWYPDERIVFGVVVDGEARAYPKHQMEVHEMINDNLGGRRIGVPYCTLCGSAQAYYLDDLPSLDALPGDRPPVLRTSGLLIRSNKMMFDLETWSLVDTFTGEATTGPLADAGVVLTPVSVVTSTWGDWKAAHPDTTILAQDGGVGREYRFDPLGDRDANGPIFPVGTIDDRLPEQEQVLGFFAADGTPVAVPVAAARVELDAGNAVEAGGRMVVADGGGLRVDGVASHQAFWFAWSQFHPDTILWSPES